MTVSNFVLPASSSDFVRMMDDKAKTLIDLGIWDFTQARYRGWRNQFITDEEEFFAACVIDTLIYRHKDQFTSALRTLVAGPMRWHLSSLVPGSSDLDLQEALKGNSLQNLAIVPAIDESEPPTKSGPFVLRRLKKTFGVSTDLMCWPWKAAEKVSNKEVATVIILDDFLGTGEQIERYLNKSFGKLSPDVSWIYATVCAHQEGIDHVKSVMPFRNHGHPQ